ncbi:MAG: phosphoadenosine phosphosulfate reductase family protein [Selenomonadaceae bacterium]|nr:phosphoadenosine phosphosulfate reductase family protein [Selenomonadaceae bacterium]MBP3723829.1 phosphoadenosine phosphosulfate reductase family protein [Selenomonadaceae bacterium]
MKSRLLCRKQSIKPADQAKWWKIINSISEYVSQKDVEIATQIVRQRILSMAAGRRVAYSWSGGKDSLVIADICQSVGITKCQCILTDVEYPAWEAFMKLNAPPGCEMINIGFDLRYLQEHEEMIFPKGKEMQKWHKMVQQNNFISYMKRENLDIVILGHRIIDGNICGAGGVRKSSHGGILYSPIFDWSHELLFAYLFYNNIELPFIYKWKDGFFQGTHYWPSRIANSVEEGYRDVYEIDPSIVIKASKILPSAKRFLEDRK